MSKIKKLAVASAIAAVGSSSAFAVNVGEPGAALLVPVAVFSSADQMNTLVGITKLGTGPAQVALNREYIDDLLIQADFPFPTASVGAPAVPSNNLHWFFFNDQSIHQLDGALAVTDQGFVGFDLGAQIMVADGGIGGAHDGMPGYLVFTDNQQFLTAGANGSDVNLYGDAAIITGNWGSAAFVPVVPLADTGAGPVSPTNHVRYGASGIPAQVSPVTAGMPLTRAAGGGNAVFNMRYFVESLGLASNASTDLVVWLDRNYAFNNLPVNIFDTDQVQNSANINLPRELNVVAAGSIPWVASKGAGHVEIVLPVAAVPLAQPDGAGTPSGVAFSLVSFGQAASDGVQTILAHQRGVRP